MALDSLGFGIGLQAQAKDYAGIAMQSIAGNRARDKAEAAARAKNEEQLNKLITDKDFIQQAGNFHKLYRGQASKEVSEFFNRAVEAKKADPNNYLPKVIQDFQQTQFRLNGLKQNSDKVIAYEKAAADPAKNSNTWFDPEFLQSVNSGTFESASDWSKVATKPGYGTLFNPATGDFEAQPNPRITDEDVTKNFYKKESMQPVGAPTGQAVSGTGGKIYALTTTKEVRPDVVEMQIKQFSNDPAYVKSKAIEWGVDMSDPNWATNIKPAIEDHIRSLTPTATKEITTRSVGGGGGGGTTVVNIPSSYSYQGDVYVPEKYISPTELLRAPGLGPKPYSWEQATEYMNKAETEKDKAEFERLRTSAVKARANIMYNAYIQDGGSADPEIAQILKKSSISDQDFSMLENFFKDKKIKTESVKTQLLKGQGSVSTQKATQYENWLSTYSSVAPSQKQIVSTFNIEDVSRLKNAPQNFDVVEDGMTKTLSDAEFLGIDKLADGTKEVRVRHNYKVKRYPYSDAWAEQISKKYKIDVTKIKFK